VPLIREYRFEDNSRVALPGMSRSAQVDAIDAALGAGLGERWVEWTDGFSEVWELLRKGFLERPYSADHAPKELVKLMRDRPTLNRAVNKLKDPRLKQMALHHAVSGGHDPRNVPWWMGVVDHVEQTFGMWTVPGGLGAIADLLEKRLGERGVTLRLGTTVDDIDTGGVWGLGVRVGEEVVNADKVVIAVDPRRMPTLARFVERTMPALPPTICHVGLSEDAPVLPPQVVLYGDAIITIDTTGTAPAGKSAWTISARGRLSEDLLSALARLKIDIRALVEARVDRSPRQQVEHNGGSSYGVLWQGRATLTGQLLTQTPIPNVYAVGAHATISPETPYVALTSALVADAIGPA
jgi:UDP-galactopyranose mutase